MAINFTRLKEEIKEWGMTLCGFHSVRVTQASPLYDARLIYWLNQKCHGQMQYMAKAPHRRLNPKYLLDSAKSIILVTLPYPWVVQTKPGYPKIATYALGRDYHKIMRSQLKKLVRLIFKKIGAFEFRIFVDSAPILEKRFAERSGIGWVGKNTLLLQKQTGSFFVLGGMCTNLPLPPDTDTQPNHCVSCTKCLDACPTDALSRPYHLNAKTCISYLTMEYKGLIPLCFRKKIGRYIFGCDECQIACPQNQKVRCSASHNDFAPRAIWLNTDLASLLCWAKDEFLKHSEGSSLRRLGYECFLRNVAVAIGNSPYSPRLMHALKKRLHYPSDLVQEHVRWAIDQLSLKCRGNHE